LVVVGLTQDRKGKGKEKRPTLRETEELESWGKKKKSQRGGKTAKPRKGGFSKSGCESQDGAMEWTGGEGDSPKTKNRKSGKRSETGRSVRGGKRKGMKKEPRDKEE